MIPFKRALIYLILLGFLPLFTVFTYSLIKQQELALLDYELSVTGEDVIRKNHEERYNKAVRKHFVKVDHFYIDNEIEKIPLLQEEVAQLKKMLDHGYHSHETHLKQRLTQLTNGQNSLSFVESPVKTYTKMQETIETLARPVEIDVKDLATILSRIEGVKIDAHTPLSTRPDLLISDFKLEKKKGPIHEAFSLHLKIIKREYQ